MSREMTILVGTVGQGVMRSADSGQSWRRIGVDQGMHSDAVVRTVVNHPSHPETVFAGSDAGLYVSEDSGGTWSLLDGLLRGQHVWALAIDPGVPGTMYAGTGTPTPAGVFRSNDGGRTWEQRPVEIAAECINVGTPRVTAIAIDPTAANRVWVGLEVDGLRLSTDSGESWRAVNGAIPNRDVHNVTVTAGPPKTVIVVVNDDIYTTIDDGATWRSVGVRDSFPWGYPRGGPGKAGRNEYRVRNHRGHHTRPNRDSDAVHRHGQHLEQPDPAGGAERRHVGGERPALRHRRYVRRQPLRIPVPQRRRRRVVGQAVEGVQRDIVCDLGAQLTG